MNTQTDHTQPCFVGMSKCTYVRPVPSSVTYNWWVRNWSSHC